MTRRRLRIGQISPLNIAIPPVKYGGTESVIYNLCEELPKRGHQVFLFGTKKDRTSALLIPILPKGLWSLPAARERTPYYAYALAKIAQEARRLQLDILHDHLGPLTLPLHGIADSIPLLHTLHVPTNADRSEVYQRMGVPLVSISNNQRKPSPHLNYVATIYNGVDTEKFAFNRTPQDYLLWVGELTTTKRKKGILEAVAVAKKNKMRLIVAGKIPSIQQKEDFSVFQTRIKPEFKEKNIKYVGEVSQKQLVTLYQKAYAFLFPIRWEEPFGLVMIEAMSCGTPVIAFRRGSVPEVMVDKKTGFIVNTVSEMARAVKKIDTIDRGEVRKHVEDNFSKERMVDEYEKLYYRLCKKCK